MEGSFADAKTSHGLGRAKMRGLEKVPKQSLMTAVAQNIKRMLMVINKKKQASLQTLASCIDNLILTFSFSPGLWSDCLVNTPFRTAPRFSYD